LKRVRSRGARLVSVVVLLAAARGCYSSVAPTAKIDPGAGDSGLPVGPPPDGDACVPRKPWEGPGVTGVLPIRSNSALVISADRYFVADFDTRSADASDPTLGAVTAWHETGDLRQLWSNAPPVVGARPWDDPGVTSVFIDKVTGDQLVISRFRRWVREGDKWIAAGNIVDDWLVGDAGPTPLDGQVPWEGAGVTATYFAPDGAFFTAVSENKGWLRRTSDPDPKNWTWVGEGGAFLLGDTTPWSTAPAVGGQRPYEGKGVTTAYYIGSKFFVVSVDKMWVHDGKSWVASGPLKDMPGWGSAPAADCAK
jgi:hypothetical protein